VRLLSLDLIAFGPFAGQALDLSARGGLDVVYGPNEAGKSTSLRAIRGLFFGIEERTGDDHRHDRKDLRVGARLEGESGETLSIVRRKGRKSTLQTPSGEAVDDARLSRMLAGVSEQVFGTMFGLDHRTLREGADALLAGHGGVGESLLEAGLGARGLRRMLTTLRAEADALHTPRAHTKPLAEALRAYKDALKKSREDALAVEAWEAQRTGLAAAEQESARLEIAQREAQEAVFRLRRVLRVLPKLRLRDTLVAERSSIGVVPSLAPSATRERENAEATRGDAIAEITRLDFEIAALERELGELVVPDALLDDEAIPLVVEERGSHRKAAQDLPKRLGELSQLDEELGRIRARLGPVSEAVLSMRAISARIRRLAPVAGLLSEGLRGDRAALADEEASLEASRRELASLPAEVDTSALVSALAAARAEGDLVGRLSRARAETARRSAAVATICRSLGFETPSSRVPSAEATLHHERILAELDREGADLERRRREAVARTSAVMEELSALLGVGDVPTEADLERARRVRDDAWRIALSSGDSAPFERALADADALADRMRREADRGARLAGLRAREEASSREVAQLEREVAASTEHTARGVAAWRALWAGAGVAPGAPAEMHSFVRRHGEAMVAREREDEARADEAAIAVAMEQHRRALATALGVDDAFPVLLARAAAMLEASAEVAARRRELERDVRDREDRASKLRRQNDERERELSAHREAWRAAISPLAADREISPEEAISLLDDLELLARGLEKRGGIEQRVRGIERDAVAFSGKVQGLVARHAPDLAGASPEDSAAELGRRRERGLEARTARRKTQEQLVDRGARRAEQVARLEDAQRRLAELRRVAGATTDDELRAFEDNVRRARTLDDKIAALGEEIVAIGDGRDLDALRAEASGMEPDAVATELENREGRLAELRDEGKAAVERTGGLRYQLDRMREERAWAANAAASAEQHLARARELAERWARARVGVSILEREIARYREANQGPVLGRASELFVRLTRDRYQGLRSTFDDDDEAVLCAVRGSDEIRVEGLSDGTRDQLYLALRLASLERHAAKAPPMPVILDDVLVHFDDTRAAAALEVLADVGDTMQVLLFSHHERIVELAEAALGERARVHRLG
jgi:uncharacterized protein YhaN